LQLLSFGEADVAHFPYFEPPDGGTLAHALELLERLGATRSGRLTEVGRALARWPVAPRLARMLFEARELGVTRRGALAAALLSERDPFRRAPRGAREARHESDSDLVDRVAVLESSPRAAPWATATSSAGPRSSSCVRGADPTAGRRRASRH